MSELIALLDGREAGVVHFERNRLRFTYSDEWRNAEGAYPLSLSMSLAAAEHPHAAIDAFLWGLLPDNEFILARWAQRFQVSPRNVFALIAHVGEDCAGAVQFVAPERLGSLRKAKPTEPEWLSPADVATRLRALKEDVSAWRAPSDTGQFSLAGAQPKTALLFDGARWGVPSGRTPTTHILKPPTEEFDGHAENEHLCLSLARAMGLPAAKSEVRSFDGMTAIVVERYDRVRVAELAASRAALAAAKAAEAAIGNDAAGARAAADAAEAASSSAALSAFAKTTPIYRVHQEDSCQALGIHPSHKYQNEGGPGPQQIIDLLRANVSPRHFKDRAERSPIEEDVRTFLDALIFNWLIAGIDAHAKNYSLLIGGGGSVRLAPLYDVASICAYSSIDIQKAKLAMKIGGEYRLRDIGIAHWKKLAAEVRVDPDALVGRARAMAAELPDRLSDEVVRARADGLAHPIIDRLAIALRDRSSRVAP